MIQRLAASCGAGQVWAPESSQFPARLPAGAKPEVMVAPVNERDVVAVLDLAQELGRTVLPRGGGSRDHWGATLRGADWILDTRHLNHVVEYQPADLTVTVQAGMELRALRELLERNGQVLPLEGPPGATMGGAVATAAAGPRRMAYGAPRDLVLGLRVALPGRGIVRSGGRVVKNVAGYDMNKLFTGSLGTLGVITEVTLKVRPRPQAERTVALIFPTVQAAIAAAHAVRCSELLPAGLTVLSPAAARRRLLSGPFALACALEETAPAVDYQTQRLGAIGHEHGAIRVEIPAPAQATELWRLLVGPQANAPCWAVRLHVLPSHLDRAWGALERALSPHADLFAHAATGTLYGAVTGGDELSPRVAKLRQEVAALGGHMMVEAAPLAGKPPDLIWGAPGPEFFLHQGIKRQLDPAGVFSAGRFLGGI